MSYGAEIYDEGSQLHVSTQLHIGGTPSICMYDFRMLVIEKYQSCDHVDKITEILDKLLRMWIKFNKNGHNKEKVDTTDNVVKIRHVNQGAQPDM